MNSYITIKQSFCVYIGTPTSVLKRYVTIGGRSLNLVVEPNFTVMISDPNQNQTLMFAAKKFNIGVSSSK